MTHRVLEHSALKWLYPGMHIKRWLVVLLLVGEWIGIRAEVDHVVTFVRGAR